MQFLIPLLPFVMISVVSYGLGSIPFGLLLSKKWGAGDIRCIGSGNIGATNVLRSGRVGLAAATVILDGLKGAGAVLLALPILRLFEGMPSPETHSFVLFLAAWCGVLGHIFPVWLGFRGGKGVATVLGVLAVLSPPVAGMIVGTWIVVVGVFRYSSLGAIVAAILLPFYGAYFKGGMFVLWSISITALIMFTHRDNIQRLKTGKESKIGVKSNAP